jgi:hypothetical protein
VVLLSPACQHLVLQQLLVWPWLTWALLGVLLLSAITATGLIWSRYSTQITPVNYNLLTVNAFMAVTGLYQLSRKFA